MYDHELINVLAPSNFAVFNCCYFVVAVVVTYILQRAETCSMLMSKNVNNDFTMNPLAANEKHLSFAAHRERGSRSYWSC